MRMTTKTHSVVDAYGNPIALKLTEDPAGHSSTPAAVRRRPKGGVCRISRLGGAMPGRRQNKTAEGICLPFRSARQAIG